MYIPFLKRVMFLDKAISHSIINDYYSFYSTFIISRDFACLSGFDDQDSFP